MEKLNALSLFLTIYIYLTLYGITQGFFYTNRFEKLNTIGKIANNIISDINEIVEHITLDDGTYSNRVNTFIHGSQYKKLDPEVHMNASELIRSKGYPCEEHTVPTEDGFLLGVQRIPSGHGHRDHTGQAHTDHTGQGHRDHTGQGQPVVLLQHGLLCSSTNWITNLANQSLGFLLADAGYDVWLGNSRGNTYSRRHVKYTPDQDQFWDWSWDEMARYDLPATVDYILSATGRSQLHYVGHSQGTLIAFAAFSQNQTLAKQVQSFSALAPVSTVGNIISPLRYMSYIYKELDELFHLLGVRDFLPSNWLLRLLAGTLCDSSIRALCGDVLFVIAGWDETQLNMTRLPVYLSHTPAGTSVRNMIHFAQMVRSGKFQMYDYMSADKNMKHYHQLTPPVYDISKLSVPVLMWSATNDWLADPKDVETLKSAISGQLKYSKVLDNWDHLDFVWGMDAATVLYHDLIKLLQDINSHK